MVYRRIYDRAILQRLGSLKEFSGILLLSLYATAITEDETEIHIILTALNGNTNLFLAQPAKHKLYTWLCLLFRKATRLLRFVK